MSRESLIQVRRGTAAQWYDTNPTLAVGEMGFETDTGKLKVGTASTAWNSLPYVTDASDVSGVFSSGIFSGSSSTDLVRITQTGTGNALVVEDETNPDSTPFVITTDGLVGIGTTTPSAALHAIGVDAIFADRSDATANPPNISFRKSRGTTAVPTVITTGDILGVLNYRGYDGSTYVTSATIRSISEGTISTGVVPSRLVFSTASSAGTVTERMRINSAGEVGIGAAPSAGRSFTVTKNITGFTTSIGIGSNGTIQNDVTVMAVGFRTGLSAIAPAGGLPFLYHYQALQGSYTGTVSIQAGYHVDSAMTGASNNYGFQGSLNASAATRYNLFMDGTAPNYLAGRLGVGVLFSSGAMGYINNTTPADIALLVQGAAAQSGDFFDIQNSAGATQFKVDSAGTLQAVTGVLELGVGRASSGFAYVDLVGDTTYTDYGLRLLRGNGGANTFSRLIHRGTGQFEITTEDAAPLLLNTSNTERMRIDGAGRVGIGATTSAGTQLIIGGITDTSASGSGIASGQTLSSTMLDYKSFWSLPALPAGATTYTQLLHFHANPFAIGDGTTLSTSAGFVASSSLGSNFSGTVTTAYGFWGNLNILAGYTRYNLYMGGTAPNYLAGRLGVGTTLTSGAMAQITNTTAADKAFLIKGAFVQSGNYFEIQNSSGSTLTALSSSGILFNGGNTSTSYGMGIGASGSGFGSASIFQANITSTLSAVAGGTLWNNSGSSAVLTIGKSRGTTVGSFDIVQNTDGLGAISIGGADGDRIIQAARIGVVVDGAPALNVMPGAITFQTNAGGTTTAERMRISAAGNVGIGTSSPSQSLDVNGVIRTTGYSEKWLVDTTTVINGAPYTVTINALTNTSYLYTATALTNFVINVQGNSGTSLNTMMAVGDQLTITFAHKNGTGAGYMTQFYIDGTLQTVGTNLFWQGGVTPTTGPAGTPVYVYIIIKTAAATFSTFVSQTKFGT